MFISHYHLSLRDCRTLRLTDGYSHHRIIYDLFPDVREEGSRGILFVDKGMDKGQRYFLILSSRKPAFPAPVGQICTTEVPERFFLYDWYYFDCMINPVRRNSASGKRTPVTGRDNVLAWFLEKSEGWGFAPKPETLEVVSMEADQFRKGASTLTINKARLTGFLSVTDRDLFIRSLTQGIGHAKAFGCGLLQLAAFQPPNR